MEFPLEIRKAEQATEDWCSRAVAGFIDSAKDVVKHPGETAATVGGGLAVGALIGFGLNNAELMGGGIGTLARFAKVGLIAAPIIHSVGKLMGAHDSANEAGHLAFEWGMFLGAAKLGSYADRIPGLGKAFGPRATSAVPENINYQVFGNQVKYSNNATSYEGPVQVRLANGKGFVTENGWTPKGVVPLQEMPLEIKGVGKLEYAPKSTTLVTESGAYTQLLKGREVSLVRDGSTISSTDGKTFNVLRPNGDRVAFHENGSISASQGNYESGTSWTIGADGSLSMRSMPAGKYKFDLAADGEGSFVYTHGTSRGIRGIGGPRVRHAPLQTETRPFTAVPSEVDIRTPFGTWSKPDLAAVPAADRANLVRALESFKALGTV